MNIEEILAASARITLCPKCCSKEGFWLGVRRDRAYVQCKSCGTSFELYKIYNIGEKSEKKAIPRISEF